jgi:brefeldin A-resistance guanine nucleotide exchange factor 1
MLLMMKPDVIHSLSRHIAYGLHDLLKTNAANIHTAYDWYTLFTLLEVVGAGTNPPPVLQCRPGVDLSQVLSDAGSQFFWFAVIYLGSILKIKF